MMLDLSTAVAQWQLAYASPEEQERLKRGTKADKPAGNANTVPLGSRGGGAHDGADAKPKADDKSKTVIRKGGGQTWEDQSLLEWDPTQFRIMVGNLAGEVTDESLAKAFDKYGVSKARVIRDKRTTKSKGYGFVSFTDGEQGFKAAREMVGKYIGSHPVTIQRSKTDIKPVVQKNDRFKGKNNKNRDNRGKKEDPLRANTGAHIEKKPVKNTAGIKMLG
ncbi:RNA-binding domain-containing protein [Teratosphaeria nubilosa]|uniref:RNA-binding domain-containing protein n=1 Tax=Teratosphaeria nubilosa TaxID=161662 RepID=A0A6G1L1X1_9PEZI|nr:RNA-binding domain-containing protein [Teratosphaeria nubilosa]